MDRLPSNIMFDIFSRLPGQCLARSRCVSKNNPQLMFPCPTETGTTDHTYVLEPKEGPFLEFLRKKPLSKASHVRIEVRECYELPPLPMRFDCSMFRESCGLGFDASTKNQQQLARCSIHFRNSWYIGHLLARTWTMEHLKVIKTLMVKWVVQGLGV
ncbi:F-box domain containing protein [Tanacetum coccineum]|uniref:F-box domain containing protein n=1 Tax=Tanacetum coccineum TaxID=301880 RepID=A0ABQ5CCL8_9ASTR